MKAPPAGPIFFDLRARECALPEGGEEIERDCGQQNLGVPECETSLQNCLRCYRICVHTVCAGRDSAAKIASDGESQPDRR